MKNKQVPLLEINNFSLSFNRYKDEKSNEKKDLETIINNLSATSVAE